jgi:HPr kinase/phosphorylase
MNVHGSCAARADAAVLITGAPGAGKSDLVLRLIDRGFILVADDQVVVTEGVARPPPELAGLLEVRGLGILRLPYLAAAPLRLIVTLATGAPRLPYPSRHPDFHLPEITIDPTPCSAAQRVALALDCALGHLHQHAGAFAP